VGEVPVQLYFDLGSPYAYLAVERATGVFGAEPVLEPILLGPIFVLRGHGSWGHTDARAANVAEVERRAAATGLPPVAWPPGWPPNTLHAMRAVLWAGHLGRGDAYAREAFRHAFVRGADLGATEALREVARAVGLPDAELEDAIADPAIKQELKDRTARAIELGVRGVPTVAIAGRLFYGDDRLEEAAAALTPRSRLST
jgi:2-hydroxychromene-2-carboxylate isomerase